MSIRLPFIHPARSSGADRAAPASKTWYSLGLAGAIENVSQDAWHLAWKISQAETGPDRGSAIFKKVGPDHRVHLYFTPSSRSIAETFGARRCAKPSPAGMSLVAGPEHAWQIHFGKLAGLRRRMGGLRMLRHAVGFPRIGVRELKMTPLNRHILGLFRQANASPRSAMPMLLALATWAEDNLPEAEMHELQPGVEALRLAQLRGAASLDALVEDMDQQLAHAQSLDEAAWLLLRGVADRMPAARRRAASEAAGQSWS